MYMYMQSLYTSHCLCDSQTGDKKINIVFNIKWTIYDKCKLVRLLKLPVIIMGVTCMNTDKTVIKATVVQVVVTYVYIFSRPSCKYSMTKMRLNTH